MAEWSKAQYLRMHGFESHYSHIFPPNLQETDVNRECSEKSVSRNNYRAHLEKKIGIWTIIETEWPSGLRRCVKAAVSSDAWLRIPLLSNFFFKFAGDRYQQGILRKSESRNNYRAHLDMKIGIWTIIETGWPSGLRRCAKAAVSSDAWIRIPLLSHFFSKFAGDRYQQGMLRKIWT